MQAINVFDGLISTHRPGTFVRWSAEDIADQINTSADRTIAIIGEAEGGAPLGVYVLNSAIKARNALRGGDLLDATLLAFAAAGTGGVTIVAVNVRGGTPATLEIPSADGGVFGTLTSLTYRERANQIQAQIVGTPAEGYTVQLKDGDTDYQITQNRVGLGLYLQYRGTGTAATAEVKMVDGQLTLITTVADKEADNLKMPLSDQITLTDLCRAIQLSGPYSAAPARDGRLLANGLDVTTAPVDIKAAQGVLTALKSDFTLFFATTGGAEVTFALGKGDAPTNKINAYFTGGKSEAAKVENWAKAMEALSNLPLSIIVPLTSNQIVLAGLRADLAIRNSAEHSRFTTLMAGYDDAKLPTTNEIPDVNAYIASVIPELNSANDYEYQLICSTGDATLPSSGRTGRLPMYLVAAMVAGQTIGTGYNETQTYRELPLSNVFPRLTHEQSDQMVRNGAYILETPVAGGLARIVRDRTTYSATNNPIYESGMSVRVMNSAARGMKAIQDRYIPGIASGKRLADFQTAATDFFERLVDVGDLASDGVDENGNAIPPFDFRIDPTRSGGRQVVSRSRVVPKSEFTTGEHSMVGRSVEFRVQS